MTSSKEFQAWLSKRAETLAIETNRFLEKLRSGLPLPEIVSTADADTALMEAAE